MVPTTSSDDILHKVTGAEVYRPDIVANNFYQDSRLAWVILAANRIKRYF